MKNKQIVGIIVAALVFVFVSTTSVFVNQRANVKKDNISSVLQALENEGISLPNEQFIGVVNVEGTIVDTGEADSILGAAGYNHQKTLRYIDQMKNSSANEGIILTVNSPGGGVYESDELYLKLMEYKNETGRPVWTYMRNQACSGGYYISMASDWVYANRNCTTGSIGVIMSTYNLTGLYKKLGIEEVNITSGRNKAMGSAGTNLTDEQMKILQSVVDESYEQFTEIVAEGRRLDIEKVIELADGRIYTAKQAKQQGLIDDIMEYDSFLDIVYETAGKNITIYEPKSSNGIFTSLFSKIEDLRPRSESEILKEVSEKMESGVPMYYVQ